MEGIAASDMKNKISLLMKDIPYRLMKSKIILTLLAVVIVYVIVNNVEWLGTTLNFEPFRDDFVQNCPLDVKDEVKLERGGAGASFDNATKISITERTFLASEGNRVFIFGAVAKNSTPSAKWDQYALYGQWYDIAHLNPSSLRCCYKYDDGYVEEQTPAHFNVRNFGQYTEQLLKADLIIWHITCNKPKVDPSLVSIARFSGCSNTSVNYLKPYFAMKQPEGHIVITTKFAYGNIDPELVVSYLETVKYFGVNKVITYVHNNLTSKVKTVLRHYANMGLVDYYTIQLADAGRTSHAFPPLGPQYHSDEWLLKRDALERSIGSTYFGIFDMDEFLIPSGDRSYQELIGDLRHTYPSAAVFYFKNIHYLTEGRLCDAECSPNCSIFKRFVMTSPDQFNSIDRKMLLITSRVQSDIIHNHHVAPLEGFQGVTCPVTEAYVRHYGSCHRKFPKSVCHYKKTWIRDGSMIDWAEKTVKRSIQNTMTFLGID